MKNAPVQKHVQKGAHEVRQGGEKVAPKCGQGAKKEGNWEAKWRSRRLREHIFTENGKLCS